MTTAVVDPATLEEKIYEYQPLDPETKQPVGNVTIFKYRTNEELLEKMQKANDNITAAYMRLKTATPTQKKTERSFEPKTLSADEAFKIGLELQNPATAQEGIRKVVEATIPVKEIKEELQESREDRRKADERAIGQQFCRIHSQDFYPCKANADILADYLTANNLEFSLDNLEIAFAFEQEKLAARPVVPVVQDPPPPPPNSEVLGARPATGGLVPGSLSGHRPARTAKLTKKDVLNLAKTNKPEFLRRMRNPALKAEMDAALSAA